MADIVLNCHRCGAQRRLQPGEKLPRREECGGCGADLHCCKGCRFFDPGRNNQCAEPQAELVTDKEAANFCDYFEPRTVVNLVNRTSAGPDEARKKFGNLFK